MKSYPGGVRHDYKDLSSPEADSKTRHWSMFAVGLALPVLVVSILVNLDEETESTVPADPTPVVSVSPAPVPETAPPTRRAAIEYAVVEEPVAVPQDNVLSLSIEAGDTLDSIFRRHNLDLADLAAMASLPDAREYLRILRPGDAIEITHENGDVVSFRREIDDIDMLEIIRADAGFESTVISRDVDIRVAAAYNTIESSPFVAGRDAGLTDSVIMDLIAIFDWDIDFLRDIRRGDQFTLLYEEWWRDGVKLRNGRVVAAEFVVQNDVYRAARYIDDTGKSDYYTPDGRSVRKAFIRNPVVFTRISGSFNPNRRHPILNTIRAHRGVDYAAPTGTPVKAAGDGRIIHRGTKGSFGRTVEIDHGGNITTLYAHLSSYGEPRVGARVSQSDIIGYVGQSGLATGPHLHYEYREHGVHRDPQTVQLPPADPIPLEYRPDFERKSAALWSQLETYKNAWLTASSE